MNSAEITSSDAYEPPQSQARWRVALRFFLSAPRRGEPSFWDDSNASAAARATTILCLLVAVFAPMLLSRGARPPVEPARPAATVSHNSRPAAPMPLMVAVEQSEDFPLDADFNVDAAGELYRRLVGKTEDARPGHMRFGQAQIQRSIVERVVSAARTAGADPALMMSIAEKESNFAPSAKASTSSASGLFQFIDTTWLRALRNFGGRYGYEDEAKAIVGEEDHPAIAPKKRAEALSLRNDPYLAAAMAAEMLKHDGAKIADLLGRPLTAGETYLLHFLGPDDATRFMTKLDAEPQASAARLLPRPARANKPIFFERVSRGRMKERSLSEVHEAFEHMMGDRLRRFADVESRLPEEVRAYAP
jgi:hypothetical protein